MVSTAPPAPPRLARERAADWALVAASAAFGAVTLATLWRDHGTAVDAMDIAAGSVACLALAVRRSRPGAVVAAGLAAGFSPLALGAGLVAIFNAALRIRDRRALAGVAAALAAAAVAFPLLNPKAEEVFKPEFPAFLLGVIAFGAGVYLRARRDLVDSLRQRAAQLADSQARQLQEARQAERRRIAREMHDELGHRLSLLSIHAGALEFRPGAPPEDIARAAGVIRASAAAALAELGQVITVLREDAGAQSATPQPGLASLPGLLDEARAAGMALSASICLPSQASPPGPASLSDAAGRAAYRVVQEGLTNSRRHAPGAPVTLAIAPAAGGGLRIEIISQAAGSCTGPSTSAGSGCGTGTGSGLAGLAERLALVGGTLEHCAGPAGSFVLRASLPPGPPRPEAR